MSIIQCPECGVDISEYASQCFKCAFPIEKFKDVPADSKEYIMYFVRSYLSCLSRELDVKFDVSGVNTDFLNKKITLLDKGHFSIVLLAMQSDHMRDFFYDSIQCLDSDPLEDYPFIFAIGIESNTLLNQGNYFFIDAISINIENQYTNIISDEVNRVLPLLKCFLNSGKYLVDLVSCNIVGGDDDYDDAKGYPGSEMMERFIFGENTLYDFYHKKVLELSYLGCISNGIKNLVKKLPTVAAFELGMISFNISLFISKCNLNVDGYEEVNCDIDKFISENINSYLNIIKSIKCNYDIDDTFCHEDKNILKHIDELTMIRKYNGFDNDIKQYLSLYKMLANMWH